MIKLPDQVIFSSLIEDVVDPGKPILDRHRLADEIMIAGDHATLFSLRDRIKSARRDIKNLEPDAQLQERIFLISTRQSIRMFQKIRGERDLIL